MRRTGSITRMRMHADEVEVTARIVTRLVDAQFPRWAGRPVRRVRSTGTVNALFRVGPDVVARLPLQPDAGDAGRAELAAEQEHARRWGDELADRSPVALPEPLGLGAPGPGYAGHWSIYRWIPGQVARPEVEGESERFAQDLAGFVGAVHHLNSAGRTGSGRGRGGPLGDLARPVRSALADVAGLVERNRLAATVQIREIGRIWDRALAAPGPSEKVWIHADLMPGNLLQRRGRLSAVIDLGAVDIGDPALDLMPAWNLLDGSARTTFRSGLTHLDDDAWRRGAGWAIVQAAIALPYYIDTNLAMAQNAVRTLTAVVSAPS